MARVWTCQRVTDGVRCRQINPRRLQICGLCGKRRPKTRQPAHRAVLAEMDYETCVKLYGEQCGICGRAPKPGKKLHRDHDHRSGQMRGLLCFPCNTALPNRIDAAWLVAAIAYLRRASAASSGD